MVVGLRTGNLKHFLNQAVKQASLYGVCGLVINLLALPAADNQLGTAQLLQMVGESGTAHIHHGREIYDALLTMAENPKQLYPCAVTELTKQLGHNLKILSGGTFLHDFFRRLTVVMG
jgi:hypothetical protein